MSLIPSHIIELSLDVISDLNLSQMSRFNNLRRLSLCPNSLKEVLDILAEVTSKLNFLGFNVMGDPGPDNTEENMLAC